MADLIRKSKLLQQLIDASGKTKTEILEIAREHPGIVSAEYTGGTLIIKTKEDSSPLVIEVELKD